MLFNSIDFALFLPLVFLLYWYVVQRSLKLQNMLLLAASYFFYSCWDWRFLFLLVFSTILDYYTGIKIHDASGKRQRKTWLLISVITNLGFLAVFKYYNFFAASFASALAMIGFKADVATLEVILPVGISFYTFHGLSYVFDIYNRKIEPSRNFTSYSLFVSFFPLLVAGPIERATHLLPQMEKPRMFNYSQAVDGLRQILWGLFKKIVIADNCAEIANQVFDHSAGYSGITLFLGAVFFAFQIYGDFSGYSDIALGTARLFGFELLRNFAFPYFSRDIAEFWRRWHISLSSWFRDYLYIPLGGNKGSMFIKMRNVFIIFLVSGFWHGANWTFIAWGALNALYILPLVLSGKNRAHLEIVAQGRLLPSPKEFGQVLFTFGLTVFAWIFFRAESISHAMLYIKNMISGLLVKSSYGEALQFSQHTVGYTLLLLLAAFIVTEWVGREQKYAIEKIGLNYPRFVRWTFYYGIAAALFFLGGSEQQFIYFQF
jgi:D-alanyl-lipoteichoic acid acyltransferase DltB (MBOAT superfamily)